MKTMQTENESCLCRFSASCEFYQEKISKPLPLKSVFKIDFCLRAPEFCARHMIYSTIGADNIPSDLMPYEVERVKEVLI
ncbi:MAG: hypothetical protein GWN76_23355 [candidate division Zixibacteria bacterium]|nr:hypothetical protein [candidate division Zixibacteria bacterium]NIS48789.1 hypothetical protein [candidate division Zixibacteria bacterium]NIU16860.1 hypothetical protein [candidate division Zixibacteria bacterium]NIX54713.1 hypothetical protein [candidate division Zixibacteria bacterium]